MSNSAIVFYGTKWCGDCRRAVKILNQTNTQFTFIDIDQNKQGELFVRTTNHGNRSVPTIVFQDGSVLVEPSDAELLEKLERINE